MQVTCGIGHPIWLTMSKIIVWHDGPRPLRHRCLTPSSAPTACRQTLRTGFNFNLPRANKLVSLHLEYAHNRIDGSAAIVTQPKPADDFRIGLRIRLQRYARH